MYLQRCLGKKRLVTFFTVKSFASVMDVHMRFQPWQIPEGLLTDETFVGQTGVASYVPLEVVLSAEGCLANVTSGPDIHY